MPSKKSLRNSVFDFYQIHKEKGKPYTVNHFAGHGYTKNHLYALLKTFDERQSSERKAGSGRPRSMSKKDQKRLAKLVNHKTGCSQRKLARKFNVSKTTITREIKHQGCLYYKRKRAPKTTPEQRERQKERLKKLSRDVFRPKGPAHIVMDDESYFTLDGCAMPGNSGFYSSDRKETPNEVKHRSESKFPEKVMVWTVISYRGLGEIYVSKKGECMNRHIYIKECLPRVKKFEKKFYKAREKKDIWFWPDLASAHYAKDTIAEMTAIDLQYITKELNPPNAPQIRPIENYWSALRQKVYENNWSAKNRKQLITRIKYCAKKVESKVYQNMFANLKSKMRRAVKNGLESLI